MCICVMLFAYILAKFISRNWDSPAEDGTYNPSNPYKLDTYLWEKQNCDLLDGKVKCLPEDKHFYVNTTVNNQD